MSAGVVKFHNKKHTLISGQIILYMLNNIKIIHIYNLTRFECVLFDVKLHSTMSAKVERRYKIKLTITSQIPAL
jgi:hypothetical protein